MRRGSWKIRIFIGLAIVAFAFIQKWSNTETNPYTGRSQHITMTSDQEIAIGLQSAPEFQSTHPDPENRIEKIKEAIEKYSNQR